MLAGAWIDASFPTWVVLVEAPSHIPSGIPTAHACNGGVSPVPQFFVKPITALDARHLRWTRVTCETQAS